MKIFETVTRDDAPASSGVAFLLLIVGCLLSSEIVTFVAIAVFFYTGAVMFFRPGRLEKTADQVMGFGAMLLSGFLFYMIYRGIC
jgi:hypothetical protein